MSLKTSLLNVGIRSNEAVINNEREQTFSMSLRPLTGAKRLRELLQDPNHLVLCPGVFDGLTARLALATGFEAIYMVSAELMS